jgi:hypothetical protein
VEKEEQRMMGRMTVQSGPGREVRSTIVEVLKWEQGEMVLGKPSQQDCLQEAQYWVTQCWVAHYSVVHYSQVVEAVIPRRAHWKTQGMGYWEKEQGYYLMGVEVEVEVEATRLQRSRVAEGSGTVVKVEASEKRVQPLLPQVHDELKLHQHLLRSRLKWLCQVC